MAAELTTHIMDVGGQPFVLPKKLDVRPQSDDIRASEWSSSNVREVSPSVINRVRRMPLGQRMAVADKVYTDATFQSIITERCGSLSGAEWDVLPFTDSPGAKARPADKKVSDGVAEMLWALDDIEELFFHLALGHRSYCLTGAETIFDESTMRPVGFRPMLDHTRWDWNKKDKAPRIFTENDKRDGEPLKPGIWIVHSAAKQNPLTEKFDLGMMFLFSVLRYAVADWATTSSKYGMPHPVAYYKDPNDFPKVVAALAKWGAGWSGVFPDTVRVEMMQAIAATKDLQQGLVQYATETASKLGQGNVLVSDAKSGTGTLANNGAQAVNLRVTKALAKGVGGSIRRQLIRVLCWIHYGPKAALRPPALVWKLAPPVDKKNLAETYEVWGRVFALQGLAAEPNHLMEVSGIPDLIATAAPQAGAPPAPTDATPAADDGTEKPTATTPGAATDAGLTNSEVMSGAAAGEIREALKDLAAGLLRPKAVIALLTRLGMTREEAEDVVSDTADNPPNVAEPTTPPKKKPATPPAAEDESKDEETDTAAAQQRAASSFGGASQADGSDSIAIRTLDDLVEFATLLGMRAHQEQVSGLRELVETARSEKWTVAQLRAAVFERYDSYDITKIGDATAEAMVVSKAIGETDVAAKESS